LKSLSNHSRRRSRKSKGFLFGGGQSPEEGPWGHKGGNPPKVRESGEGMKGITLEKGGAQMAKIRLTLCIKVGRAWTGKSRRMEV